MPYRTEEEGSGRTAGGEKEGKQVERTGWRRRRLPGGLAWLYAGRNRRNKGSLRHSFFFFSLCLLISHFCTTSAATVSLFFPPFQPFFLSMLLLSLLFIVPYLCSAHSFHFCPCVFERPFSSWEMSLAGDLCQHGSDYASLPGVGVKHGQRHHVPGRWHHTESTACRTTWRRLSSPTRAHPTPSVYWRKKNFQVGQKFTL